MVLQIVNFALVGKGDTPLNPVGGRAAPYNPPLPGESPDPLLKTRGGKFPPHTPLLKTRGGKFPPHTPLLKTRGGKFPPHTPLLKMRGGKFPPWEKTARYPPDSSRGSLPILLPTPLLKTRGGGGCAFPSNLSSFTDIF